MNSINNEEYGTDCCVHYVHQLQNLYFALTNTELEKVVCGSKSFHGGGLNHDLDIGLLKEIGYASGISCKRCREWFKKHYL